MSVSVNCMAMAQEEGFRRRVRYFVIKAAVAVMAEDAGTANHADRVTFANSVLEVAPGANTPGVDFQRYVEAVTTNATIAATIDGGGEPSDNDIEFTVDSMFNAFAGVSL